MQWLLKTWRIAQLRLARGRRQQPGSFRDFSKNEATFAINNSFRMSSTNQPPRRSLNNTKKLFTVLATLVAITLGAIILVFFWYRFKSMLKQRRKKRKFLNHQRHFNTPVTRSPLPPLPRYASVDVLGSTQSEHLLANDQSQFQAPSSMIYNNIDSIDKDPVDNEFNEDETPTLC